MIYDLRYMMYVHDWPFTIHHFEVLCSKNFQ